MKNSVRPVEPNPSAALRGRKGTAAIFLLLAAVLLLLQPSLLAAPVRSPGAATVAGQPQSQDNPLYAVNEVEPPPAPLEEEGPAPEVAEPVIVEPEVVEPEIVEPEVAEPEVFIPESEPVEVEPVQPPPRAADPGATVSKPGPGDKRRPPPSGPPRTGRSTEARPRAAQAPGSPMPGAPSLAGQEDSFVTIDFNDVDISLFIKYISELTGKNFIVDRTVKGKVTIISPTRITAEDAYFVFQSVLEVYGFTTVESGSVTKIIPSVQARSKSIQTIKDAGALYPEDKVVTQLIPLTYSDPEEVKRLIAPLLSKSSVAISHPDSGMLILTDVLSNINRLLEIIKTLDVPSVGDEMVVIPLQYASADSVAKALSQLFVKTATKQGQKADTVKIIPYERTNSLIVIAGRSSIQKVRDLVAKIDTEAPKGTGKILVYYLQHARADEIVKVLTSLPSDKPAGGGAAGGAAAGGAPAGTVQAASNVPPISKDLKIMADAETNSLIITGPRDEYLALEEVIKKLDIPRRMVYIEALIMEVSVTKSFEIGVQWGGAGTFNDGTGKLFTGFSGGSGDKSYPQLQGTGNLASDAPVMPSGFTLGVLQQGVKIGNVFFPNLAAVAKAYKDDADVEIIATPQILTTDNKKAEIKVGENVPYITSRNVTTAQQDYTNYEYKDVATSLKILPQINQSDLVRLEIGVEVIKLKDQNSASTTPTTLKRTADTTVVLHNEETVVIGGIIGQDSSSSEYKVPLLGDLPLVGWLFKTHGDFQGKTNLFIFITPHIVENPAELATLYYQKRDVMEYVKKGSSAIPEFKFSYEPRPSHAAALADLGFAKMQEHDYVQARQFFEQALKIDEANPAALYNLGAVSEMEGDRTQAADLYQRFLALPPPSAEMPPEAVQQIGTMQQSAVESLRRLGVQPKQVEQDGSVPPPPAPEDTPLDLAPPPETRPEPVPPVEPPPQSGPSAQVTEEPSA